MNPPLCCYRNSPSSGPNLGWLQPGYVEYMATFALVCDSPQPFSIWGYEPLARLKAISPGTIRCAHVLTRNLQQAPDKTTFTGLMQIEFPWDAAHRVLDGAGNPTHDLDLAKCGDAYLDFVKREVINKTLPDGSRAWDSVLLDFFPPFEPHAEWERLCARLVRLAPSGFLLGLNGNGACPPGFGLTLIEGYPHQLHGTFAKVRAMREDPARRHCTPILFAAAVAAPPDTRFFDQREKLLGDAAMLGCYACHEPGEAEGGPPAPTWWKDPAWRDLPRVDLGRPRGPITKFPSGLRRVFDHGEVIADPNWSAGTGWACISGGNKP